MTFRIPVSTKPFYFLLSVLFIFSLFVCVSLNVKSVFPLDIKLPSIRFSEQNANRIVDIISLRRPFKVQFILLRGKYTLQKHIFAICGSLSYHYRLVHTKQGPLQRSFGFVNWSKIDGFEVTVALQ